MAAADRNNDQPPTTRAKKKTKSDGVIRELRDALTNKGDYHEPWTSGTIELSDTETTVFYERQDGTYNALKLGSVNEAQVEDLSRACSPATFGLNHQDVLDESYRKASKLDAGKIGWLFNPSGHGDFLRDLTSGLFPWSSLSRGIRFELYKLNVYGKGSFFKAHQDTPRGEDMFGSLVILLPTAHKGGNLHLVHRGREFRFDGQALLRGSPSTSVAYVAFFSDVEHEVTHVTSGHRVTITFNIYFDSCIAPPLIQTPTTIEHPLKTVLKKILADNFLQIAHKHIGFGLAHSYPSRKTVSNPDSTKLKGSDATLIQILTELEIPYKFLLLYRECEENNTCPFRILTPAIVDGVEEEYDFGEFISAPDAYLIWHKESKEVEKAPPDDSSWYMWYCELKKKVSMKKRIKSLDVEWVTEPNEEILDRSVTYTYGNEATLEYHYHQLCVLVTFQPRDDVKSGNTSGKLGKSKRG